MVFVINVYRFIQQVLIVFHNIPLMRYSERVSLEEFQRLLVVVVVISCTYNVHFQREHSKK
jgi:hypothetical protein